MARIIGAPRKLRMALIKHVFAHVYLDLVKQSVY